VVHEHGAVGPDDHIRVVQACGAVLGFLTKSDTHDAAGDARAVADGGEFGAVGVDGFLGHAVEEGVVFGGRAQGTPDWEGGDEGFGEDDEVGFVCSGAGDGGEGFVGCGARVEEDGGQVACCYAEIGCHCSICCAT